MASRLVIIFFPSIGNGGMLRGLAPVAMIMFLALISRVSPLPAERVEAASRQVEQELARFLRRMPAPAFAATSRRALVDRLRQELDLPPL